MSLSGRIPSPLKVQPYTGSSVGIVIGIDVGTTFSGVSYAILRPDEVPAVQHIPRYTCQTSGDSKIPSIMYYKGSEMKAAGAQAVTDEVQQDAIIDGWEKVEYFKMHMRPTEINIKTNGLDLGSLPNQLTPAKVIGDFLRYLDTEAIQYIENHHVDGAKLIKANKSYVLSLPNGWTGLPQQNMRKAAILGGLVRNAEEAQAKIKFISEGEASALACLANGLCPPNLKPGYRFMIADAGGGTIDITSYEITKISPKLEMKEIASSDCRFAGSVFVNAKAKELLRKKLKGSKFSNPDEIDEIINDSFELKTKRTFNDSQVASWLQVGSRRDNDSERGIRMGKLRIEGTELAECYSFSITEALESIKRQISVCGGKPMPVWLVGGFGASPWLLKQLQEGLADIGVLVSRPDMYLAKAVADGNVLHSLGRMVSSRFSRNTYGVETSVRYDVLNHEHWARTHFQYKGADGILRIPGAFSVIIAKDTEVQEATYIAQPYEYVVPISDTRVFMSKISLLVYTGEKPVPSWYGNNEDKFCKACTITADLSNLRCDENLHTFGFLKWWNLRFFIEISFGGTELEARIKWFEKGEAKYGPATIFHEE